MTALGHDDGGGEGCNGERRTNPLRRATDGGEKWRERLPHLEGCLQEA